MAAAPAGRAPGGETLRRPWRRWRRRAPSTAAPLPSSSSQPEELEPTQLTTYMPSTAPGARGRDHHRARVDAPRPRTEAQPLRRRRHPVPVAPRRGGHRHPVADRRHDRAASRPSSAPKFDWSTRVKSKRPSCWPVLRRRGRGDRGRPAAPPPVVTVMGHVDHGKTCCWTASVDRTWSPARPAASPSTSGPTRSSWHGQLDHLHRHARSRGLHGHARPRRAGRPTSWCWWWRPTTASCRRRSKPSTTPRRPTCPIVVAVNKIDQPDADPNRVMQQLSEHGLVPEAWGGDTIIVEVSAPAGPGIDELLEQLALLAEVVELTASPEGPARGDGARGRARAPAAAQWRRSRRSTARCASATRRGWCGLGQASRR